MNPSFSDASVKGQTRTKITVADNATTSDSAISLSDGLGQESRKRKRDGSTADDLLRDTFVVRVCYSILQWWTGLTTSSHIPLKPQQKPEHCSLWFFYRDLNYHYRIWTSSLPRTNCPGPGFSNRTSKYWNWKSEWETSQWC